MQKRIVYVDLDGVLVDLKGYIRTKFTQQYIDEVGLSWIIDRDRKAFYDAEPIEGAVEAFQSLSSNPELDVYLLSTAPWDNVGAWSAKRVWVEKWLGPAAQKRLILTHHKNLLMGDVLIDDRENNGADKFTGEWIKFGTKPFETWSKVLQHITHSL